MRRTPTAVIATLTATGLLAVGCGGDPSGADGPPSPAPEPTAASSWDAGVTWQPCPDVPDEALSQALPAGVLPAFLVDWLTGLAVEVLTIGRSYECGTLTVPRDWADPDGPTFDLGLVRIPARDPDERIGSLVLNPGGPGASGVHAAAYLSVLPLVGGLPDEVTERFDIVGFDPRGVGRSSPVECFTSEALDERFGSDPDPVSQEDFDQAVAASRRRVNACEAKYGEALNYYSTRQTAHDLEAIRVAVGDERLTYLGYSYGTLLGAVYAHIYPESVRALVLDGAVDPSRGGGDREQSDGGGGQAAGFERAFDNFAAWCAAEQCPLRPDARAAVTAAIEQARVAPVLGSGGRDATAGWVFHAVVAALYQQALWPQLATAIDDLERGEPAGVFTLADVYAGRDGEGNYSNLFDANTAINCADDDSDRTVEDIRAQQERMRAEYPLFGGPLAVMSLDCVQWPAEPDPYPYGAAEGAPPILVVGTTGDPATPYEQTARLADLLGTGVVLTWDSEGHTVYPEDGCVNDAVNAYLVDLTVPAEGTVCAPGG